MTARRTAARTVAGPAPLATPLALAAVAGLTVFGSLATAGTAAAHGSMTNPVSRVSACYAEGPENPKSAACKAAVRAGGTQALYDWNEVNIGDVAGRHQQRIPDGKLCSAGRDKYKGLDLPRADWPATTMKSGAHTFAYRATAPHRGSFQLYITKDGYDPSKPLKWSDLEAKPFASVTDPTLRNGSYVFNGTVPRKTGRHLIYSVWQRSDSPEAFYTCSDVVFGKAAAASAGEAAAPAAPAAPSDAQIAAGASKSTVDHGGHGGDDHQPQTAPGTAGAPGTSGAGDAKDVRPKSAPAGGGGTDDRSTGTNGTTTGNQPAPNGSATPVRTENLAQTGGSGTTLPLAVGGAAVLALGAAAMILAPRLRRRRGLPPTR
ncbi:lytic polysaccharide monooxygenase auxiliary activity family 9 protein [Streptomyces sp. URMC 123]|uniref:lytic polysaccharide monooxygenase auxiliary activity family 9 protein n=1 Tax=Streptomyces sp. URMC 123 TaxID=3423403 RepID=UPI003F1C4560